ncbi:MAG TPA: hypothetical protein VF403_01960, partial [Kofleriaceae bacterium]
MSAKTMLWTMIAGSVAVMLIAARRPDPRPAPTPLRAHERPWLSPEATRQIIGPEGGLGPLFSDVELGGSAPAPEVRARIAEFARANDVDIRFEVVAGELVAVRFAVTFGGCCGYEGADTLGRQLGRARTWSCCNCKPDWVDDWAITLDNGVHVRGHVHVNRVEVRWEQAANLAALLDRAETVTGKTRASLRESADDRWTDFASDRSLLEVAYPFGGANDDGFAVRLAARDDLGLHVVTRRGRVVEVAFRLRDVQDADELAATLRKRWGRPRFVTEKPTTWAWRTRGLEITAEVEDSATRIDIRDPVNSERPEAD